MGANLNISIGATLEPLKRSITGVMSMMSQFASNLGTQGAAMKAQIDKASADINKELESATQGFSNFNRQASDGSAKANAGFVTMRTQLRQATNEAYRLAEQFGMDSAEAIQAQRKVAMLKEEMSDMDNRVKAMNPEAKFQALGAALKGSVGIMQGAQGAMAAFGGESEQTQEAIAKLQGLMALSSGIDAIAGMKDTFKDLKTSILANVGAMNTMKGALIATGIGALAIGVGLLIANFDKVTDSIYEFVTGEKQATDTTEQLAKETEAYNKILEGTVKNMNFALDTAKIMNDSQADGVKKSTKAAEIEYMKQWNELYALYKKKEIGESDFQSRDKALKAKYNKDIAAINADATKEQLEKQKEAHNKYLEKEKEKAAKQLEIKTSLRQIELNAISNQFQRERAEADFKYAEDIDKIEELYSKKLVTAEEYEIAKSNLVKAYSDKVSKIESDSAAFTAAAVKESEEKKQDALEKTIQQIEKNEAIKQKAFKAEAERMALLQEAMNETDSSFKKSQAVVVDFGAAIHSLAVDSFVALGEAIGDIATGQNGLESFFNKMGGIISGFLVQIGKALIATAIASDAFKKAFASPAVALAAGIAAIAVGTALKNQLQKGPAFANGGIVYGPTVGLMGEYSGAKSNPEVIAPLDKLKSMIGGGNMNVQGLLYGNDLAIVNSRTMSFTNRRR